MRLQAWREGARALAVGMVLMAGAAQAGQRQIDGVRMPDSLTLQGRKVALAHMAMHKRLFFKVYVWSLYLEEQPRTASEAIASNSIKRLHFRFLRGISRDQLVDSFRGGLQQSPELRQGPLADNLRLLLASLRDVPKGGDLVITYVPDAGVEVSGHATGGVFIPGKPFADALFAVWLNAHPIFPR